MKNYLFHNPKAIQLHAVNYSKLVDQDDMPKLKTLVITTVCLLFLYSTYAIFRTDGYTANTSHSMTASPALIQQTVADLSSWPAWTDPESAHLKYEIDSSSDNVILRWNTPGTLNSGYRERLSADTNKVVFRLVDGQGAEFIETITISVADTGKTMVNWQIEGNSDEFVEKLMRPAIRYALTSSRDTYLDNLSTYLMLQ